MSFLLRFFSPRTALQTFGVYLFFAVIALWSDLVMHHVGDHGTPASAIHIILTIIAVTPVCLFAAWLFYYHGRAQDQLKRVADTDHLTGLMSRRAFMHDAEGRLNGDQHVLMLLDVDHFKQVNDCYGHLQGDACLRDVAQLMRDICPNDSLIGRLGGEEFAVLMPPATSAEVDAMVDQIVKGVRIDAKDTIKPKAVTLSAGVYCLTPTCDLAAALKLADDALYAAKARGRAQGIWTSSPCTGAVSSF